MERFLFIVDERLPLGLVAEVLRLRDDVGKIYQRPVEFANLLTKLPVKGSDFTKKGEIIRTTEYGVQRNAKQILKAAEELLGVNNQHIVFITVDDITCECKERESGYLNFCFGLASEGNNAIVSVARFRDLPIYEQKDMLSGMIMHEIGHIFGVAMNPKRRKTEYNRGRHCTCDRCVMQQGNTLEKMRLNLLGAANNPKSYRNPCRKYYCRLCARDIKKTLNH